MKNSSVRIVKQTYQNLCFGLIFEFSKSWLFIFHVLVLTPKTLLACWGGGGGGGGESPAPDVQKENTSRPDIPTAMDDVLYINLTGVTNVVDRNVKAAWNGWVPSNKTQNEWKAWYEAWKLENEKNGEGKKKGIGGKDEGEDGPGGPGGHGPGGPDDVRGPGSGWPKLPGWADLGAGNPGVPIPPWAYVPKNIGRPNICYLPPIKGKCRPKEQQNTAGTRYGFNPYTDQCEKYEWSGCGGTRNRFTTQAACEKRCMQDPPPSCSASSGLPDRPGLLFNELQHS